MTNPHDLNDLRLFVQVAQAGGYAAASRQSGVSRATLSRRVAALEQALGVRLIARNSRSFGLTQAGTELFKRGETAVALADEAFAALDDGGGALRGVVRFAAPPSLLQLRLDGMALAFMAEHPLVRVEIESTNRRVDLVREGFDFAVRAGDSSHGPLDQVVTPFAEVAHVLAISPDRAGEVGETLADTLQRIRPLAWGGVGRPAHWRLRAHDGAERLMRLEPILAVEDMVMLKRAAVAGLGMALLPRFMVQQELEDGQLLALQLDLQAPTGRIHAAHLGQRGMRPVARALLDWLRRGYRDVC